MTEKTLAYTHHASYTMAGLLGAGALYGGLVKNSRASLLAGGLLAAGYAGSGYYASMGEYLLSNQIGAIAGAGLTLGMGMRYLRTRSPVAIVLSTLGAVSTTFHGVHWSRIEPIEITGTKATKKLDDLTK